MKTVAFAGTKRLVAQYLVLLCAVLVLSLVPVFAYADQTVYVSRSGVIHYISNCSGMKRYTAMSLEEALNRGYRECSNCFYAKHTSTPSASEEPKPSGQEVVAPVEETGRFKDVPNSHWVVEQGYLYAAVDEGLITGYNATTFGPEDKITRAQVATILYRAYHPDSNATRDQSSYEANATILKDVRSYDYYTAAVNWAFSEGIVTGDKNANGSYKGTFRPDDPITREDFALILSRYAEHCGVIGDGSYAQLSDSRTVSAYAKDGVDWCYTNGIASGKEINGNRLLDPHANATRAEATKMCYVAVHLTPTNFAEAKSALTSARGHLEDNSGWSYEMMLDQLLSEGVSYESARFGVDHCDADWEEEASKAARRYLKGNPDSSTEDIETFLVSVEGFTAEQAEYGARQQG